MASINGILFPNIENSLEELEERSVEQSTFEEPDLGDYAAESFTGGIRQGITYGLGAMLTGAGTPKYNEQQLLELYPDVPAETWKGGANAFQAEYLADRYKDQLYKKELYDFVSGVSDPTAGAGRGLVTDTVGALAELGGGLMDPLTLGVFKATSVGVKALQTPLTKIAPMFMSKIATSRLTTMVAAEVAENVVGDVAVTYPLRKFVLDDYEKQDTTLRDTVAQAIGSAVAFSAIRYAYGSTIGKMFKRNAGAEFMEKMKEDNFGKTKDKVNSHVNSDSANTATFEEAAAHTATSPLGTEKSSVSERVSTKAFDAGNTPTFDSTKAPFFGVYDQKSGKADYSGDRWGDTHIFVSSPEAAQGLFDTYAKNGNEYTIYGHRGDLNTIDLEISKAVDHPDILDIIELEQGRRYLENINEDSSLADVFREVNNIAIDEGASGRDISNMFDEINTLLAGDGYDGTTHFENQGNTRHTVMSVFDEAMRREDIEALKKGVSEKPLDPKPEPEVVVRTDEPFTTMDGKKVEITEPLPPDTFYDDDVDFKEKLNKYNDPTYLAEVEAGKADYDKMPDVVEENIKEITEDLLASLNLQKVYHGSAHTFDKFSTTKIGSGEGAQVYGHGLYFAQNPDVANFYRDTVGKTHGKQGHVYEAVIPKDTLFADWEGQVGGQPKEIQSKLITLAENLPEKANLSAQEKADTAALNELLKNDKEMAARYHSSLKVKEIYRNYAEALGSQEAASQVFKEAGIQGIVYVDGTSRGGEGKKTGNMVVFDDSAVTMVKRDDVTFNQDYLAELQEKAKAIQEEYKNNHPDQESEIAKAIENCIRKN